MWYYSHMKQKHKHTVINRYTLSTLVVLIGAVVVYGALTFKNNTTEAASPKSEAAESYFSFTGADGWRQGPTNKTSMALFHGHDCFVSVEYKTGTIDVTVELARIQAGLADMGYTNSPSTVLTVPLQSSEGHKQYQLHQYDVTGSGSAGQIKGGQEYGYLQFQNGYVEVEGHCDTANQLPATIPALQAIKFDDAVL